MSWKMGNDQKWKIIKKGNNWKIKERKKIQLKRLPKINISLAMLAF